jgi:AcrR family transcriptional regulator
MLYDALERLMRSQPYNTITVTQLVQAANLGRTTFYRNFDEIEDILRLRCDQVFDELITYIVKYQQEDHSRSRGAKLKPLLRYFYLNSDIINLLLQAKRLDILQDSFRERSHVLKVRAAQLTQMAEEHIAYVVEIRINVMIAILAHWVKTGKRQAPDDLADSLKAVLNNMVAMEQLL